MLEGKVRRSGPRPLVMSDSRHPGSGDYLKSEEDLEAQTPPQAVFALFCLQKRNMESKSSLQYPAADAALWRNGSDYSGIESGIERGTTNAS